MKKVIPVTMIKLSTNQKMDTKKSINDYRKDEWDPFRDYVIGRDGRMSCMSANTFENEVVRWKELTHHEKIACVNFVKDMNMKYRKNHEYNKLMKKFTGFEV